MATTTGKVKKSQSDAGFWQSLRTNPIIIKELRGRMRVWRGTFDVAVYSAVLAVFTLIVIASNFNATTSCFNPNGPNTGKPLILQCNDYYYSYNSTQGGLIGLIIAQIILVSIVAPVFTSGALASEKERQTYDILLITLLRPRDIVFGKMFASLAYILLMIVAGLPIATVLFLLGGIGLDQLFIGVLLIVTTALLASAIAIFASAATRTTARALLSSVLLMAVIGLGIPALGQVLRIVHYQITFNPNAGFNTPGTVGGQVYEMPGWLIQAQNFLYSFNPVYALAQTFSLLDRTYLSDRNLWFYHDDGTNTNILMPWYVFALLALVMTAFFVWWATKMVKPMKSEAEKGMRRLGRKRAKVKAEVATTNEN